MNIDAVIEVLETKIKSMLSDEDVSATKIASLVNVLLKLYDFRNKTKNKR